MSPSLLSMVSSEEATSFDCDVVRYKGITTITNKLWITTPFTIYHAAGSSGCDIQKMFSAKHVDLQHHTEESISCKCRVI